MEMPPNARFGHSIAVQAARVQVQQPCAVNRFFTFNAWGVKGVRHSYVGTYFRSY